MSCNIENSQHKETSWRRVDGQPLPYNSKLIGGRLIIEVSEHDAAGVYECTVLDNNQLIPIARTELTIIGELLSGRLQCYFIDFVLP